MVATFERWCSLPEVAPVLSELERYGEGEPLAACPALRTLFADRHSAPTFVGALVRHFCRTLADEPFGHPPLRHGYERGTSTLLLARRGRAHLVLHAREPGRRTFGSVTLSDGERREAVIGGLARARVVSRADSAEPFAINSRVLCPGSRLALDLAREALQVLAAERRLVSLRLDRAAERPGPVREYALGQGALLRQASGDIRASRHEAMLAVLGRMNCREAVPVLAAIAAEDGADSLRWQALREALALDTASGFGALCAVARAAPDPLAAPATALRDRLAKAHPSLLSLETDSCLGN